MKASQVRADARYHYKNWPVARLQIKRRALASRLLVVEERLGEQGLGLITPTLAEALIVLAIGETDE